MRHILRSLIFALCLVPSFALAQSAPAVMPYHTVLGRLGAAPGDSGPAQAIPFATLLTFIGSVPTTRSILTTAPLAGGGDLSVDRTISITTNGISNTLIRQSAALSLVGRSANSTGNVADISAVAASSCAFIESGSTIICGQLATAGLANNAVTLAKLATQAANTTLSNATSGTAVPTAFAMPSCSTSASALNWTTNTGFGCNSAISAAIANITGLGTGNATMLAIATGSAGGPTQTIASGTSALGTGAITSGTCATVVTTAATNTATTDVVLASFNSDPSAVTGYIPSTAGMLTILSYPTANNVNFKTCNNTASSVTPGAITLNWRVVR